MVSVILWFVTGRQVGSRVSPPRFFVHGAIRDRAQHSNKTAIRPDDRAREGRARRFIHERHELIGKPRHGAADTNPTDIRTTADPSIQPRFVTLQFTTGPQQPTFTRHFGDPYSWAKSA